MSDDDSLVQAVEWSSDQGYLFFELSDQQQKSILRYLAAKGKTQQPPAAEPAPAPAPAPAATEPEPEPEPGQDEESGEDDEEGEEELEAEEPETPAQLWQRYRAEAMLILNAEHAEDGGDKPSAAAANALARELLQDDDHPLPASASRRRA